MVQKKYGLFTAIAMIVGIVIGSGIFFKSDDILFFTGGDVKKGVIVFCIAALSIIFGSLCFGELATRTDKPGGLMNYAEVFLNKKISCAFGWFHTFLYLPTINCVVAWVVGIYWCILFGMEGTLEQQIIIGVIALTAIYALNILSAKMGGYFQNASMVIKLVPLVLIGVAGVFFGNPSTVITPEQVETVKSFSFIAALAPIAFAFDGWIVATSIAHEITDAKKNLPRALFIAPLFILALYLLYFVGISSLVGPQEIIGLKNAHVDVAANMVFGDFGAKIILSIVIISVLGTVNGITLGLIRMPYSLAIRNMIPKAEALSTVNEKLDIPVNSAILGYFVCLLWFALHYLTQKLNLLPNSDISEISIVMNYVFYILLYAKLIKMTRNGEVKNKFIGIICPVLATIGSLVILYAGMLNPLFWYYIAICMALLVGSVIYYNADSKKRLG